ncbi:motility associated factor glycosyltransferase family protein [Kaarinaea lacus]
MSDFSTDPYAYQISIIAERWPGVADFVNRIETSYNISFSEDTPQTTIIINGIHVCSAYDAEKEARLQCRHISEDAAEIWLYGIGTDDVIVELLNRSHLKRLNIVLISPGCFRECLRYFDQRRWLTDSRVHMLLPQDQRNINKPYAVMPACLRLIDDSAVKLRDLIVADINAGFSSQRIIEDEAKHKHIELNFESIKNDFDVRTLFAKNQGQTIYVAGAGPSLASQFDTLRQTPSDVLICVDAALKPLLDAGIEPSYVVSIDAHETIIADLLDCNLGHPESVALVYFPTVHPNTLTVWQGPRYVAYSPSPLFAEVSKQLSRGTLFSSGSVIHPAIDLAVKMGAEEIKLCGVDFSYPRQQSHVSGAVTFEKMDVSSKQYWVFDGHGNKVTSDPNFLAYLRDLEMYINTQPTVRFINLSREGARIEGTVYEDE